MTARGRVNSSTDWDPMKDDYNNTSYDTHYPDNDTSGRSAQTYPLDHRKLYITNLPAGLNEQGLKSAFEKYGQVEQAFLSRDPSKKYALIRYETPAEARIAMMKLNRTEPLNLCVNLAHNTNGTKDRDRGLRDSGSYVSSSSKERRSRNQDEEVNGEGEPEEETMGLPLNQRQVHIELAKIKLERLKLQEEQLSCKEKMMLLQLEKRPNSNTVVVGSSRRLLPDGRIIVQEKVQEAEASITAGAGDSRVAKQACIVCGANADLYCGRCSVTPYCSAHCQRRDWSARHSAVCHNLTRLKSADKAAANGSVDDNVEEALPAPPATLRRPRSPNGNRNQTQRDRLANTSNSSKVSDEPQRERSEPTIYKNSKARFVPPDHHPQPIRHCVVRTYKNKLQDDEEWGTEKKIEQKPAPKPQVIAEPIPKLMDIKVEPPKRLNSTKSDSSFKPNARMGANLSPESAVRPAEVALVPAQYLIEKLPIGETFLLSVDQYASNCATKQLGFVCLAMHADFQEQYNMLLGDIFLNEAPYKPQPGTTFAYFDRSDEGWYRARSLSHFRAALLDAGRVVTITEDGHYRALAPEYVNIPEFCCVLQGNVETDMSLKCTILMKTDDGYKVSIDSHTEDAYLGEATITRWMPEVELGAIAQPKPKKVQTVQPRNEKTPTQASNQPLPSPEKTQAKPEKTQPKPKKTQAKPEKTQPKPEKTQPQPEKTQPKPEKTQPRLETQFSVEKSPQTLQSIPEVPRPPIINNGHYMLMHVTSLKRACVRSCEAAATAEFENVLQDAAICGVKTAKQLTEPPLPGQLVLSLFEDVHYRALVKRTKASQNKYMVEYVEYGNEEVVPIEKLFSCPTELDLTSRPAQATIVALSTISSSELTLPAKQYLDTVREQVELIATIPGGAKTAPSGSLVQLAVAKNKESINKKLEEMCTPEWKKLEEGGGDVFESAVMLFPDMKTLPLPTDRPFVLDVTDFSNLETGVVCGFERGVELADYVCGPLTDKMNEYCKSELCSEPYLPMVEELCIAMLPPYPQWFRAVVVDHRPGAATAAVLFVDYGNVEADVPVAHLRKCMPEFYRDPALAATADIKDWPKSVRSEQMLRAFEFLKINDEGRGELRVRHCKRIEDELTYIIEVPELIAAINSV